jgi:hypothetical protein
VAFPPGEEPNERIWDRLVGEGFERTERGDQAPRAFRYMDPEEVAGGGELKITEQAQSLVDRVIESFQLGRRTLGIPESIAYRDHVAGR